MTSTRTLLALLAAASAVGLTGCVAQRSADDPGIADAEIVRAIANLDGVASSGVEFDNSFGNGARYRGDVEVEPGADATCVLVQTMGLLAQGRPGAALSSVEVHQDGVLLTVNDLTAEQSRALDATTPASDGVPVVPPCG